MQATSSSNSTSGDDTMSMNANAVGQRHECTEVMKLLSWDCVEAR